ncbi:hypothetical protein DFJ74DRAFT_685015 [Hyaloraphidium curvatum]|nr:hypothetical protein DFJ74DRAFT_685015 [Hyaloraphidium curvatum]
MQTQEQFDRDEELAIRLSQRIFECDICACEHPVDDVFLFSSGCAGNHMYCRRCISAHVRSEMQALHIPVICPGCKASPQGSGAAVGEMCQADVELVLGDGDMQRYLQLSLEMWKLASGRGVVVCPYPDCRGLVLLEEEDEEEVHMVCQVDNSHEWCRKCEGGKWHNDSTCEQYQQWLQENGNGDRLMDELFRGKAWKRCTSCREGVEKTEGCNHMTCRCGGHFCYLCNTNLPANAPYEHFREPSSPCYNKLFDAAELAESEEDEE